MEKNLGTFRFGRSFTGKAMLLVCCVCDCHDIDKSNCRHELIRPLACTILRKHDEAPVVEKGSSGTTVDLRP